MARETALYMYSKDTSQAHRLTHLMHRTTHSKNIIHVQHSQCMLFNHATSPICI